MSYKETVTLMECLFLHLNQVLDTDLEYKENTILLEKKLLGHYQVNTRFRSGFIHIMLFNTPKKKPNLRYSHYVIMTSMPNLPVLM